MCWNETTIMNYCYVRLFEHVIQVWFHVRSSLGLAFRNPQSTIHKHTSRPGMALLNINILYTELVENTYRNEPYGSQSGINKWRLWASYKTT